MVYDDDTRDPPYRSIPSSDQPYEPDRGISHHTLAAIREMVREHPGWGPKQIHALIRRFHTDVTLAQVRTVMG